MKGNRCKSVKEREAISELLVSLFQNKSSCKTFDMKIRLICMKMSS